MINFEDAKDIYDWEVGKHGIIVKADYEGDHYSATYLPEVASEQGWDRITTLKSLLRKADYEGKFEEIEPYIKLTKYQSSKANLSFDEYQKM